ncbi:hypothetical protein TTHERM_001194835 (macronuclear) [Tetrahymena thermophila SB210]|uniref:Uncharacterized protein n=1 Tax=Tetrahymena thermophila (strain SB210) TaxID=312017 RepID=W7X9X6_TETTS|nr:hypothetical protein TTHERM_001194835 [Tetrahymena thermophila SB210]EWS74127.1 hypothetical protein TTHERM_001194835 [Tetrahymena thermophila SB210]|eukprot:XP_012653339.1 hypothetical protein TTHERM_001194835 [Tetrahymena thermophila SB210]
MPEQSKIALNFYSYQLQLNKKLTLNTQIKQREVSILRPLSYEPNAIPLRHPAQREVSILRPLSYEPNAIPLRHPARLETYYSEMRTSLLKIQREVSILRPLSYEHNAIPLRYPARLETQNSVM